MDITHDHALVSRRERPSKAALSRESIVAATLKLLDEGVDKLTMRRVAAALDTGPASLYVYVRDTEELHSAVLEELLGKSGLLDSKRHVGGSWRERIIDLLMRYTELLLAYPTVARVTAFTRPVGSNYMRLTERLLALQVEGGVSLREAGWGIDLLLQLAETTATEQGSRSAQEQARDDEVLRAAIQSLVAANSPDLPYVVAEGEDLLSGEGPERGVWGFEVILNGLLATPRPGTTTVRKE
jgi:AcrR family transcriptional regulator